MTRSHQVHMKLQEINCIIGWFNMPFLLLCLQINFIFIYSLSWCGSIGEDDILSLTILLAILSFVSMQFFLLSEFFFYPLLGRARFWGRCWADIQSSHRPEPSGRAVHGEVDRMDIGGQHGRRFVLLCHTHRPQRRPYSICTSRSWNVWHRCGGC